MCLVQLSSFINLRFGFSHHETVSIFCSPSSPPTLGARASRRCLLTQLRRLHAPTKRRNAAARRAARRRRGRWQAQTTRRTHGQDWDTICNSTFVSISRDTQVPCERMDVTPTEGGERTPPGPGSAGRRVPRERDSLREGTVQHGPKQDSIRAKRTKGRRRTRCSQNQR